MLYGDPGSDETLVTMEVTGRLSLGRVDVTPRCRVHSWPMRHLAPICQLAVRQSPSSTRCAYLKASRQAWEEVQKCRELEVCRAGACTVSGFILGRGKRRSASEWAKALL